MNERTKEIGDHSMAERRAQSQRVVVTMEFGNGFGGDVRRNKSHLAASGEQVRVSRLTDTRQHRQQAEKEKERQRKLSKLLYATQSLVVVVVSR